jgi:RNA polymerase sigma-70 factor (ECF subfamily)
MSPGTPGEHDVSANTSWATVRAAGDERSPDRDAALSRLLIRYQPVLRAQLAVKWQLSPDQVDDLVQSFIQEKILERNLLAMADPQKGKFRTFLLTALDRFVIDSSRKESRLPTGGQPLAGPAAESAPDVFDVAWAMQVLVESVRRMQAECTRKQRADLWGVFEGRTLVPLCGGSPTPYKVLANRYGLASEKQAANRHAIAEAMFRRNLQQTLAEYADDEIESEVEEFRALFSRARAELVEELRIHLWTSLPEVTMSSLDQQRVDVRLLARLMELPAAPTEPGELLRRLLATPVPLDLSSLDPETGGKVRAWADSEKLVLRSFGELFEHPHPLLDLLEFVKDFAKENRTDSESPLPREVATALYYTSIAVALARCGQRITRHDDATLRQGFQWGIDQPWVEESVRALLRAGLQQVAGAEPAAG